MEAVYAVGPNGRAPGDYLKDQYDGHRISKTPFPPPKDFLWLIRYENNLVEDRVDSVRLRGDHLDRPAKSAKQIFSDYIEALGIHATKEIPSKCSETPFNRFHKEVLLVVPNSWPDDLKNTILQVGSSLL